MQEKTYKEWNWASGQTARLIPPLIAVCSQKPFSDVKKAMFTKDEYMMNSINVTKTVLHDVYISDKPFAEKDKDKQTQKYFDTQDLLTLNGHCTLFRFKDKVSIFLSDIF